MKLLIVTQVFYPEIGTGSLRMTTLASVLVQKGHDVTVLCPVASYPARDLYQNEEFSDWGIFAAEPERVHTVRIPCLGIREKFSKVNRCLNYVSFWLGCRAHINRHHDYDAVIATSPQLLSGLAGIRAKHFGIPFIFDVRDLWPEIISEMKIFRFRPLLNVLYRLENRILKQADAICINSADYEAHIRKKCPNKEIVYIPNMIPDAVLHREVQVKAHRPLTISYTGNIGLAQDFDTLLGAAYRLRDEQDILFQIYGAGSARRDLEERIRSLSLPNVHLCNAVPRKYISEIMAQTDLCYIGIKNSRTFQSVTPGKLGEYFSFGKPVLLSACGISRAIVEKSQAGYGVDPGDSAALAEILLQLAHDRGETIKAMSEHALEYASRHYAASVLVHEYELLLERNLKNHEKKPNQN